MTYQSFQLISIRTTKAAQNEKMPNSNILPIDNNEIEHRSGQKKQTPMKNTAKLTNVTFFKISP
jgi:hypothetical protein